MRCELGVWAGRTSGAVSTAAQKVTSRRPLAMKPGRRVASPRSTTRAPAGMARLEPASRIFEPSTMMTAFAIVASDRPSNIRAAFKTVTAGGAAGAGAWPSAADDRPAVTRETAKILFMFPPLPRKPISL